MVDLISMWNQVLRLLDGRASYVRFTISSQLTHFASKILI